MATPDRSVQLNAIFTVVVHNLYVQNSTLYSSLLQLCPSSADDLRYVIFDLANHSYQIARIDPDSETTAYIPINNPVGNIDYIVAFGSGPNRQLAGVELSSYSLNGDNQIKFGIYGELDQASNAKITLACDGYQITLTIEPSTGEVSFSEISKVAVEIEE